MERADEGKQIADNHDARKSESAGRRQADPAVYIQRNRAVIPPDRMKDLLEHIGSRILDDRAAGRADQKDLPACKAAGIQHRHEIEHNQRCYSRRPVDRADGTVEEASVLPVFRFKCTVNRLPDPSHKAENNKVDKVSGNDHVVSPLRALVRAWSALSESLRLCVASGCRRGPLPAESHAEPLYQIRLRARHNIR